MPFRRKESPTTLGLRFWLRVLLLVAGAAFLTWFGKIRPHSVSVARTHGMIAWILPTSQGLSTLWIFPDDNHSNEVRTGLRIWLAVPSEPQQWESLEHILYRGRELIATSETMNATKASQLASMIDTGGILRLLGPMANTIPSTKSLEHLRLRTEAPHTLPVGWLSASAGQDIHAQLEFASDDLPARLNLAWDGYQTRWWANAAQARADHSFDSLSLGIIAQCVPDSEEIPFAQEARVRGLIACGGKSLLHPDSSRIILRQTNEGALFVEDISQNQLSLKRIHTSSIINSP